MSKTLNELTALFDSLWPLSGQDQWDRSGLLIGDLDQSISKVLLAVDVTKEVLKEAKELGAELLLAHHPLLLKGVSYLSQDQLKGSLVSWAIKNDIAVYAAHTNADIVKDGVSDVLAKRIGLKQTKPLVSTGEDIGHGRVGSLENPLSLLEFANLVASLLPKTNAPVRVAGDLEKRVKVVAVVGGAGDSFIAEASLMGVDVFLTSDLRHHVVLDSTSNPSSSMGVIDVSHFAAESLWLQVAAKQLADKMADVSFVVSEINTDPWSMTIIGE
jgi:dinuclear metal center YbgI/SA1388 family protein